MKIISIGPAHPFRGGIADFNESLCREFLKTNKDTSIITFTIQYPSFLFPGKTQYKETLAPTDIVIEQLIHSFNPLNWFIVTKKILKQKPDVVIFNYWMPFFAPCYSFIARKLRKHNIKIIGLLHNLIPHEKKIGDNFFNKLFISSCHGFIALSQSVLHDIQQFSPTTNKIFSPHPIYDIFGDKLPKEQAREKLGIPFDDKIVLFFGLVRSYKGLDLLLKAFSLHTVRKLNIKLWVVGEFYEPLEHYKSLIRKYDIEDFVTIQNTFVPDKDVKLYFSACDIVAQPYITATQSGITQIAFNFDTPMLVTNVGGLAEIVPHGTGGYVCPKDANIIAESLIDFFNNNRYESFSKEISRLKYRFSWNEMVQNIYTLINNSK
ncbi:MAG: glycosyltransferase [Bacteroidales bacterium]